MKRKDISGQRDSNNNRFRLELLKDVHDAGSPQEVIGHWDLLKNFDGTLRRQSLEHFVEFLELGGFLLKAQPSGPNPITPCEKRRCSTIRHHEAR